MGSEVSFSDHRLAQTPKEAFSEVRVHSGTTQADFEVDRPPPTDSPPGGLLITMMKETVILYKRVPKKMKKRNLFISLIDLMVMKTQLTARLPLTVKRANVVVGLRKEIFARTHSYPQAYICSAPYCDHDDSHLIIVCGAPRPMA